MLKKLPEVGQRVIANMNHFDVSAGKSYEVTACSENTFCIIDNNMDENWFNLSWNFTLEETAITSEEPIFQIGDEVWCLLFGKGAVTDVTQDSSLDYPVIVKFAEEEEEEVTYTRDGKHYKDQNRTLYFSEPKIEAALTRPFKSKLVGKTVVVTRYGVLNASLPFVVSSELEDRIHKQGGGCYLKSDLEAVYEVSSENLL